MIDIEIIYKTNSKNLFNKEKEIIEKYILGYNILTLSKEYDSSENSIRKILVENNTKLRTRKECRNTDIYKLNYSKGKAKIKDQTIINSIIEEYKNGGSCVEMGSKYGVTHRTILNILRKNNITIKSNIEAQNHSYTKQRVFDANIKKFGVGNPMQHPDVFEKSNLNRFKYKTCIINEVTFDRLQGYEEQGIRYILEKYPNITIHDIKAGRCQDLPKIKYQYDVERLYFPDIYIPKLNLLVEVKCEYTFKNNLQMNLEKQKASFDAGYKHLIIVFSDDGKTHLYNV
jgi:Mor family transcriptional regulator